MRFYRNNKIRKDVSYILIHSVRLFL